MVPVRGCVVIDAEQAGVNDCSGDREYLMQYFTRLPLVHNCCLSLAICIYSPSLAFTSSQYDAFYFACLFFSLFCCDEAGANEVPAVANEASPNMELKEDVEARCWN